MAENTSTYPNSASDLANQATEAGRQAMEKAADAAAVAKNKAQDLGRNAAEMIDRKRGSAAGALDTASSTLHEHAENLPGGPRVAHLAHSTADKLQSAASYVRENDTKQMMADVEEVIRKYPVQSLLIAAGVGFVVARAFRDEG